MRVMFIIPSLRGGGAERAVLNIARGLSERGHKVDLAIFSPKLSYPKEVLEKVRLSVLCDPKEISKQELMGYSGKILWNHERSSVYGVLISLSSRVFFNQKFKNTSTMFNLLGYSVFRYHELDRGLRTLRLVQSRSPDIVFPVLIKAEYAGFFGAMLASRSPRIIPIFQNIEYLASKHRKRRRYLLGAADHIVTASDGVAENFSATHGVARDNMTTIHNPAFTPEIARHATQEPDHPWFGDGGPPIILGAGNLKPQKDFSTLIEAFHRVRGERPCRLLILGEGQLRYELESQVQALGLEGHVSLPGWTENPFAYMARAALFVLSSRFEGFGNVLVEALACGCPAVSTDCQAGPAEILEDPELLAPVGDREVLAQVMQRALARPADEEALRAKAARFSIDRAVDKYEKLIADTVARYPKIVR